jgi:adenosylcobinamide-GDP ribazoletransferase
MSGLLGAIQFLTRVPVRTSGAVGHQRIVPWFPIVGVLIGAVVGGLAAALAELVPPMVAAACALVAGLLLTGAFHEDGLADVCDAFAGGTAPERRLEILKDPRHGTYGVSAIAASVLLRWVSIAAVGSSAAMFAGLVAAHALGRASAVATMLVLPPATEHGLGASHSHRLRTGPTALGVTAAVAAVAALTGWWVAPLLAVALVGSVAVGWMAMRKIGGLVGDVLGAIEQVVECGVLVVVSGLAAHHALWWD